MDKKWFNRVEKEWTKVYEGGKDLNSIALEGLLSRTRLSYVLEEDNKRLKEENSKLRKELEQYKGLMGKDKHVLIKSNINHIRKIEELEKGM